ncbi:MAG: bifunctional phosphoribosylaminoimidazolecarboxamide formyltransferase/IMP cyclohydrolase PurH [Armatimonadetes bacterium CG_4_8_14_3_um_filter_58_9]|nr:MAG: bifunctional phosphoribosylaminoimidazolecarboxamide formyltransferase/IMP cyclohydrolase PurH [Armatimonadetes bacterium CG_4_8_14_3_um_filter_58_9]
MSQIEAQGIQPIDLVAVNLYPFAETIAKPGVTEKDAIENIDIGGPSMVRSASKNFSSVTIVVHPEDYSRVIAEIKERGNTSAETRRLLAVKAFAHTSEYDAMIHNYLWGRAKAADLVEGSFPDALRVTATKLSDLRYGENPHQRAAAYRLLNAPKGSIARAKQLSGKAISYNNYQDADAAWQLVKEYNEPAAAIVKHANPCGCAEAATLAEAFRLAWEADPISRFGGIIACNRPLDGPTADMMLSKGNKFDVIIVPGYEEGIPARIKERTNWGETICVLEAETPEPLGDMPPAVLTQIDGGLLMQDADTYQIQSADLKVISEREPTETELADLLFAWKVVRHVKSNAIVLAKNKSLTGMGAGQPNRVTSVQLSLQQAGEKANGSVLASDAFFPFPDGPETAAKAGVTAIMQPGGSAKDADAIAVANQYGMAMVFTGIRHFLH